MRLARALAFLAASWLLHAALAALLQGLPPRVVLAKPSRVEVRLVAPPEPEPLPPEPEPTPEPEPEPAPEPPEVLEPTPPPPEPPPKVRTKLKPVAKAQPTPKPVQSDRPTPANERPDANADPDAEPVFGVDVASTSASGNGPAVQTGNTLQGPRGDPKGAKGPVKALRGAPPVPVDEVSKMPMPLGRCEARYTDEARAAGIEGTVELELVVDVDGSTREVKVRRGLGHGLDQAAIAALKRCRFRPGTRGSEPVAVRIAVFKIRFFLEQD